MNKEELSRYIDRAFIAGKHVATNDIATYLQRKSVELFEEGKDQAAAELRDTAKLLQTQCEALGRQADDLKRQEQSEIRKEKTMTEAVVELESSLQVGTE